MNLSKMMGQVQAMQARMAELNEQLDQLHVEGQAGAGMVRLTLNGKGVLTAAKIDPSLFSGEEADVIEDLLVAAHADAKRQLEEKTKDAVKEMSGGLDLPAGFKLPF